LGPSPATAEAQHNRHPNPGTWAGGRAEETRSTLLRIQAVALRGLAYSEFGTLCSSELSSFSFERT